MKWSNVKLIFSREVRDQLRDRRTLFTIAVLPIFLYPLLGMLVFQVMQFTREYPVRIWIVGSEHLPRQPRLIEGTLFSAGLFSYPKDNKLLEVVLADSDSDAKGSEELQFEAKRAVQSGDFDAVIIFPPSFSEQLERFRKQLGDSRLPIHDEAVGEIPSPRIIYDQTRDESRVAKERLAMVLHNWRENIGREYLKQNNISEILAKPFVAEETDVASEDQRRAAVWSKLLPFVILIWALTGAFYPAIDLCAGEKERGTLETLLCSPARRGEIVWGKLLTIMLFSGATALLNLVSMSVTATLMMGQLEQLEQTFPELPMGMPPLVSLVWLIVALIPVSALFSALSLALATFARSAKEGQYYLMPLLLVTMPLIVLPVLPSVQLELGTSLIPVTGLMLLLKSLMESDYQLALLHVIPVIGMTAICCLFAIRWAIDQFNNESVLFRESERVDLGLWLRHIVRNRGDTPSIGAALLCATFLLILRFFANFQLSTPESWSELAMVTIISQIAFFAAPALIMAFILTRNPRATLLFRMPVGFTLPAAFLLAALLHPTAMTISTQLQELYPAPEQLQIMVQKLINDAPNIWALLLVLALTPAICEELAFRGFILSGLRHLGHPSWAILLTSLLFGVAHGIIQQSIAASIVGCVIGYLAVQSGSILTCILFHLTHNSLAIFSQVLMDDFLAFFPAAKWAVQSIEGGYAYSWPFVVASLALAVLILVWFSRLPHQLYAEEQLQEAIDNQTVRAVTK